MTFRLSFQKTIMLKGLIHSILTLASFLMIHTASLAADTSTYESMRLYQDIKRDHPKQPDSEILDYFFNFGAISYDEKAAESYANQYRTYSPKKDPDLLPSYKSRRKGSFHRIDELGPFPRGEALMVRWRYKRHVYEDHVDLKALLSGMNFKDEGQTLYEAKTGFEIYVKVIADEIRVFTKLRGEPINLLYSRHVK